MVRIELYLTLLLLSAGLALALGSRGEKWVGATLLAGNGLTMLVEHLPGQSFTAFSPAYLALDAVLALVLCGIAIRFPSWVSICVAAFQINGTLGHLVKLVAVDTIPFSYAFLLRVWAWPMVLALLLSRGIPSMRATLLNKNWPPFVTRPS